jgi:cytochrome c oxidase assembly protein Cox11
MPFHKNKIKDEEVITPIDVSVDNSDSIKINKNNKSSISEFIERPLPSENEVRDFEAKLKNRTVSSESVSDELLEIYEDARGNIVDVKKISIKKRRGWFGRFLQKAFFLVLIGAVLYVAYQYFIKNKFNNSNLLEISISAPKEVANGDEVFYTIDYNNLSNSKLENIKIEITYPDNFIFSESLPSPTQNKNTWEILALGPKSNGSLKIKGSLINKDASDNLLLLRATYNLENFSTEFKKEISAVTKIKGIGFDVEFNAASTALIGEDNEVTAIFSNYQKLPDFFNLIFTLPENITIVSESLTDKNRQAGDENKLNFEKITADTWLVSGFKKELSSQDLRFKYRVKEKNAEKQNINIRFEKKAENNQNYTFLEKDIAVDVVKSNLNLVLSLNDNKSDQPINLGNTLNYAINYSNKDVTAMKDVVIMAVVDGDFIDWNTLEDKNHGLLKKGLITWTKNEILDLKELGPGKEGVINFSVKTMPFKNSDIGKNFEISAYSQFSIGNGEELKLGSDNKSNVIVSKINSNFDFSEKMLYFNEDNIPVGTGPLPPKVGETAGLRVYWEIKNDLHELNNTQIEYVLPVGVSFNNNVKATVGVINYDEANRKIIWEIGRMPTTVYTATAEFSINLTPSESDRNKIMFISNGATATAKDIETQSLITKTSKAQTSKLEDDDIAGIDNDGRVQ